MTIRKMCTLLILNLVFVVPSLAHGSNFCLEIAKRGLFDKYSGNTFNAGYSYSYDQYCRRFEDSKSSKSRLGIIDPSSSFNFSSDDERRTAEFVCSKSFNADMFRSSSSNISRILSDNAVKAIELCSRKSGLVVEPKYQGEDLLVVDVHYSPTPGEANSAREVTSRAQVSGEITCKGPLFEANVGEKINNNIKAMVCERTGNGSQMVNSLYGKSTVYPGGAVTIFTSAESLTLALPKKVIGPKCSPRTVVFPAPEMKNLCAGASCLGYANLITDTRKASKRNKADLRKLTYSANIPSCGDYKLIASYAMHESRPVTLKLDNELVSNSVLGGKNDNLRVATEYVELIMPLRAGTHTFSFEKQGPFPHVESIKLEPF